MRDSCIVWRAAFLVRALFGIAPLAAQVEPESYALSQTVIVQVGATPRLYFARRDSSVEAVDVRSGRLLWSTRAAAYRLMARRDRLLALLPPRQRQSGWRLAVLDARSGRILAPLPSWGGGSGTLEEGLGSRTTLSVVFLAGRDYLVWHSQWHAVSGAYRREPPPVHADSGAAAVDVFAATLVPTNESVPVPDARYRALAAGGYTLGPFDVDGVSVMGAREYRDGKFRIVLHRERGGDSLPDVELCEPSRNSDYVALSVDHRHILAGCQDPNTTPRYSYDLRVHSTVGGEQVGQYLSESWPGSAIVWGDRLVHFAPDWVRIAAMSAGKQLFEGATRNLAYRGPYPP